MKTYTLTESELASFADDSIRAEIRSRVSADSFENETITIQSETGDVYDVVSGSVTLDDLGVVLTDEQIAERRESDEANAAREAAIEADALRIETEIKPLVMQRLRALARQEVREEIRELKAEIFELRASMATLKKKVPDEIRELEKQNLELRTSLTTLKKKAREDARELENQNLELRKQLPKTESVES